MNNTSGGDPKYLSMLEELRDLHIKKAADYGTGEDPLANLRASKLLGIEPWIGAILRMSDKLFRVHSLIKNGSLKNESIEDNLIDMSSYALLALLLKRELDDAKGIRGPLTMVAREEIQDDHGRC